MNGSYMDYDYPRNLSRPVNSSARSSSTTTVSASSTSTTSGTSQPSSRVNKFMSFMQQAHSITGKSVQLQSVVPLSQTAQNTAAGLYYDVPKNIPVDPRFVDPTAASLPVAMPKFPVNNLMAFNDRPQLPQKSPVVLNKMSTYNYMNSPLISPPKVNDSSTAGITTLTTKPNTTKPLPPLPGAEAVHRSTNALNRSIYDVPSKNGAVDSLVKYKYTDIYSAQDDEEDCDYDYDYVCLESKKKLDDEDESIKKLVSRDLQSKYERLVLNSQSGLDLQNLEKSLQHSASLNSNVKKQFLQSYRYMLSTALKIFENWINLSLEIIERNHPPSVYINFTKHILLSGQNLLLVAKSFNRHYGHIQSLSHFADSFYDFLRQIVLKTKRAASEHPSGKSIDEMVESIRSALQFTSHLNLELLQ